MVTLTALTKFESRYGPNYDALTTSYGSADQGGAAPDIAQDQETGALEEVFKANHARCHADLINGMSYQETEGTAKTRGPGSSSHLRHARCVRIRFWRHFTKAVLPFSVLLSTPGRGIRRLRKGFVFFGGLAGQYSEFCIWLTFGALETMCTRKSGGRCLLVWPARTRFLCGVRQGGI